MNTVTATYAKQNFGACVSDAMREPVVIEKSGRPAVVMMSYADFQRLNDLEDAEWLRRAQEAAAEGYATQNDSDGFMNKRLAKIRTEQK